MLLHLLSISVLLRSPAVPTKTLMFVLRRLWLDGRQRGWGSSDRQRETVQPFSLTELGCWVLLKQTLLECSSRYLLSDPVECLGYFCFSSRAKKQVLALNPKATSLRQSHSPWGRGEPSCCGGAVGRAPWLSRSAPSASGAGCVN